MKKNIINSIFGLAVASLMLTACSSADDAVTQSPAAAIDDNAINFGAYMNRTTTRGGKPGELTTTILQGDDYGFGVMAYYTDNQPYTPNAIPNFMYNQQVTYDGTATAWTYSPVKYWPNEFGAAAQSTSMDRLSFFAYAPYTEVDPVTGFATDDEYGIVGMTRSAENGNPKVRYYVNFNPSEQVDLCWAEPNPDLTKQPVASNVAFNFSHALAALNVQIDAKVDGAQGLDGNTRIWVRSVTFEGLAVKGELNLNNDEMDKPIWNDLYSNGLLIGEPVTIHDGRRDGREGFAEMPNEKPIALNASLVQNEAYEFDLNDVMTKPVAPGVTTDAVNLFEGATLATDPIYVIPTGEALRITIVYDVETVDWNLMSSFLSDTVTNGSSIENTITKVVTIGDTTNPLTLKAGKKYTVNLHLGMTSVKTTATVAEWTAGDNGNADLPANN